MKIQDALFGFLIKQRGSFIILCDKTKINEDPLLQKANLVIKMVFKVLSAAALKSSRGQTVIWKFKNVFTLKELKESKGFGELYLIDKLVDNKKIIQTANDMPQFLKKLDKRYGEKNKKIMLRIYSKISWVIVGDFMNIWIQNIMDISKYFEDNDNIEWGLLLFSILSNILKVDRSYSLRDKLTKTLGFSKLYYFLQKVDEIWTDEFVEYNKDLGWDLFNSLNMNELTIKNTEKIEQLEFLKMKRWFRYKEILIWNLISSFINSHFSLRDQTLDNYMFKFEDLVENFIDPSIVCLENINNNSFTFHSGKETK